MGSGDHNNVSNKNKKNRTLDFHIHMHHHHHHHNPHEIKKDVKEDIPKGCLAVMVGHGEGELQRFVIPVMNINHPLFLDLLKEAEEVYGFDHEGPINIPCRVEQFRNVQDMIDQEIHSHHHHHHHVHQHHHHHIWCFKA